jgi:hypothetical protein
MDLSYTNLRKLSLDELNAMFQTAANHLNSLRSTDGLGKGPTIDVEIAGFRFTTVHCAAGENQWAEIFDKQVLNTIFGAIANKVRYPDALILSSTYVDYAKSSDKGKEMIEFLKASGVVVSEITLIKIGKELMKRDAEAGK